MQLSSEEHRLLINRMINDAIVHERMCRGIQNMLNSVTLNDDSLFDPIYFGVDTAIDLMGFMGNREDHYVMNKLYDYYLDQIKLDLNTPISLRKKPTAFAIEIVKEWFSMVSRYKAQLN